MATAERSDGQIARTRLVFWPDRLTPGHIDVLVYIGTFIVAMSFAVFLYFGLDIWNGDSLSRTVDAYTVLFLRDPHLGAIGFSWPPIPTFTRIMLLPITRPLGLAEFTGQISSVIFAAAAVVMLNRVLRALRVEPVARTIWIIVTLGNPVIVFHFTNGTAESLFTALILVILFWTLQLRVSPFPAILWMGLSAGVALWVRYEALAVAMMAAGGLVLFAVADQHIARRDFVERLEGLLITMLVPTTFMGMLWMFFNWSIQGDPLFFYTGLYSIKGALDVARNNADHPLAFAYGSITGTLWYIGQRILQMSFILPVVSAAACVIGWKRRDMAGPALVAVSLATVLMQTYQAYSGAIPPWLRYWVYLPIFSLVLIGYLNESTTFLRRSTWTARTARYLLIPVVILAGNYVSFRAMHEPRSGVDEQIFVLEMQGRHDETAALRAFYPERALMRDIADYLRPTTGTVLVDRERGAAFVITIDDPRRLVVNSDRDFEDNLRNPIGRVNWVLLPNPSDQTSAAILRDSVYTYYPGLYDGAPWLELEREFPGDPDWRLYRVKR